MRSTAEKKFFVVVMVPMGDEILVYGTSQEVSAMKPREMKSFPIERLLAGGWTMADVKTPAQVKAELRAVKGPHFDCDHAPSLVSWVNRRGQSVTMPVEDAFS